MLCSDVSPIHSLNLLYCTLLKKPTNKSMHLVYFLNLTNQRKTKAEDLASSKKTTIKR